MGRRFNYERAEQEANKIGLEFAHSNDVVKDMSRAYHVDFSNIKVHTDSAADNKVKAAGKDALAQGNDIFFGKGIFESSDPADKGLVAHEFAHTMQQGTAMGGEMAVAESAPMGVAQGGIRDWFRKKKIQNMEISEPTLVRGQGPAQRNYGEDKDGLYLNNAGSDIKTTKLRFETEKARALYELTKNMSPEELKAEGVQDAILDVFKTDMTDRLKRFEDKSYEETYSNIIRQDNAGEWVMYNRLFSANVSDALRDGVVKNYNSSGDIDQTLAWTAENALGDAGLSRVLQSGMEVLGTSKHFGGENEGNASEMLMNGMMLRGINPKLNEQGAAIRNEWVTERFNAIPGLDKMSKDQRNRERANLEADARNAKIGSEYNNAAINLQKAVNNGGRTEGAKKFLKMLVGRYKK